VFTVPLTRVKLLTVIGEVPASVPFRFRFVTDSGALAVTVPLSTLRLPSAAAPVTVRLPASWISPAPIEVAPA
jgi:hypothetical protein